MPAFEWQDLSAAFALYLVIEGLMPAIAPRRFRETVRTMAGMDDRILRLVGLGSMVSGALLLTWVRS